MTESPQGVSPPLIRPRYIDDVPILALTFWSEEIDHYLLRRLVAEVEDIVKQEPNVSITTIIGGEPRQVNVRLDPLRLSAYGLDMEQVTNLVTAANQASDSGSFPSRKGQVVVHTGGPSQGCRGCGPGGYQCVQGTASIFKGCGKN